MIKAIHVDDNSDDLLLTKMNFKRLNADLDITSVDSPLKALELIEKDQFDVILSDYQMPEMNGLQLLKEVRESNKDLPFIFLTGQGNEALAVEALKAGANDYYSKNFGFINQERLLNTIQKVVKSTWLSREKKAIERDLKTAEKRIETIFNESSLGIAIIESGGVIKEKNRSFCRIFGCNDSSLNILDMVPEQQRQQLANTLEEFETNQRRSFAGEMIFKQSNEQVAHIQTNLSIVLDKANNFSHIVSLFEDVTEKTLFREEINRLGGILDKSSNEIYMFDVQTLKFVYVNQGVLDNLGYSKSELFQLKPVDLKPEINDVKFRQILEDLSSSKNNEIRFETVHRRKDGSSYPVEISLQHSGLQNSQVYIALVTDITERKETENTLRKYQGKLEHMVGARTEELITINRQLKQEVQERITAEKLLRDQAVFLINIYDSIPYPFYVIDTKSREIIAANKAGKKANFEEGIKCSNCLNIASKPCDFGGDKCPMSTVVKTGLPVTMEHHHIDDEGKRNDYEIHAYPLKDESGEVAQMIEIIVDVSERTRLAREKESILQNQMKMMAGVFNNAIEGVSITDKEGKIIKVNPAFSQITGYSEKEAIGQNPRILKSDVHPKEFYENMWASLEKRGEWCGEIWNRRKNGQVYPEWLSIKSITDINNQVTHHVAVFHDITDHKNSIDKIQFLSSYDVLTNLPNKANFESYLENSISETGKGKSKHAIVNIDLDDFMMINDSLGHAKGDAVIKAVAERLSSSVRGMDLISRVGGDEFLILYKNIKEVNDLEMMAKRLLQVFKKPFRIGTDDVHITASMGIAIYPFNGMSASELIKNSDIAMYKAKEKGKSKYHFFTSELGKAITESINIENNLRTALEEKRYVLHYQPKVDTRTSQITGAEALIRMAGNDGSLISPGKFIPVLENSEMIYDVGYWVLETAVATLKQWHSSFTKQLSISVNLSARQFQHENLVEKTSRILNKYDLPAENLVLEITETTIMSNLDRAVRVMNDFSKRGFSLSIDDFGMGYSSLGYLKEFPVNEIKIDRSFISNLPENHTDAAIVKTIISLAENLNFNLVAEGVETEEQKFFLENNGCEYMQGFLFGKPVDNKEFQQLLTNSNIFKRLQPFNMSKIAVNQ